MKIANIILLWIFIVTETHGKDLCVLDYGCECLLEYKQIRCSGNSLTHISEPYKLAFLEYTHLDYSANMITDVEMEELLQWNRMDYLDLRNNPLTATSCDIIEQFMVDNIGKTVLTSCRCVPRR